MNIWDWDLNLKQLGIEPSYVLSPCTNALHKEILV